MRSFRKIMFAVVCAAGWVFAGAPASAWVSLPAGHGVLSTTHVEKAASSSSRYYARKAAARSATIRTQTRRTFYQTHARRYEQKKAYYRAQAKRDEAKRRRSSVRRGISY